MYARDEYIATGGPQSFAISFPYLQRAHVEVLINGALQVEGIGYSWTTDTLISMTPTAGDVVVIQRNTSRPSRVTNYIDGSALPAANLNVDSKQAFYMAQEAMDLVTETDTRLTADIGDLDAAVAVHETRLDGHDTLLTGLVSNDSALDARLTAAESDIDGLQAAMVGALNAVNDLQAADVALDARVDVLEAAGPGAAALNDLTDVTITAPTDGQVLKYDSGTGTWVNDTDGGSAAVAWGGITGSLSDQTDLNAALGGKANATHTHTETELRVASGSAGQVLAVKASDPTRMEFIDVPPRGLTQEEVDDRVAALLVAGTNVTLTYDDGAGTLTIAAAGGGGGGTWGSITGTLSDQTDLNSALSGKAAASHTHVEDDVAGSRYHEGPTAPGVISVGDEWFDTTSGILYKRIDNGGSPVWAEMNTDGPPTPSGVSTSVQYNDGGAMAGDANLTWDKTGRLFRAYGNITQNVAAPPALSSIIHGSSGTWQFSGSVLWGTTGENFRLFSNCYANSSHSYIAPGTSSGGMLWFAGQNWEFYAFPSGSAGRTVTPVLGLRVADDGVTVDSGRIRFPVTQIPSTDPNTLDDYKEGSWTPTDGSGAGLSFTGAAGRYIKIGKQVTVWGELTYPSTANGSDAKIGGLPFTANNVGVSFFAGSVGYTTETALRGAMVGANTAVINLYQAGSSMINSIMSSDSVYFSVTYEAAA